MLVLPLPWSATQKAPPLGATPMPHGSTRFEVAYQGRTGLIRNQICLQITAREHAARFKRLEPSLASASFARAKRALAARTNCVAPTRHETPFSQANCCVACRMPLWRRTGIAAVPEAASLFSAPTISAPIFSAQANSASSRHWPGRDETETPCGTGPHALGNLPVPRTFLRKGPDRAEPLFLVFLGP